VPLPRLVRARNYLFPKPVAAGSMKLLRNWHLLCSCSSWQHKSILDAGKHNRIVGKGMKTMTPLGQKVKELRIAKGMTQQRLAEKAEATHSLISALESGRRKYVSAGDVERLASGLDMPSDELWKLIPGGRSDQRYISITETGGMETHRAA